MSGAYSVNNKTLCTHAPKDVQVHFANLVTITATSMLPSILIIIDTTYLVAHFNSLEEQIKTMSNKINDLEKEISTITIMFNCDECGYGSSTEPVLKRHMTTKHKNNSTKHKSVIHWYLRHF